MPSSIVTVTSPSRATETARLCVRTSTPAARRAASTSADANGSSRTITRGEPSSTTTFVPSEDHACASSTPTTPTQDDEAIAAAAWRSSPRGCPTGPPPARPGIGGGAGPVPVAMTTAVRASNESSPTRIRFSPSKLAWPRTSTTPRSSSQGSCDESSSWWMTSSRLASTAAASTPSTRKPGTRRDSASSSPGPQQRLRGHAGVVGALAADQMLFDDRDLEAGCAEPTGGDLARRAGAR